MKKIFTLLVALGMFTLAQAQPGTRDNRNGDRKDNIPVDQRNPNKDYNNGRDIVNDRTPYDNDRYDDRISPERRRDMEIAKINREYDYKIQRVKNNFFMNRWEKQRQIRFLQEERQREIRMVYIKFSKRNKYDKHHDRSKHHY